MSADFQRRSYLAAQVVLLFVMVLPFMNRPFWDDELFSVRTASSIEVLKETCRLYENNMVAYYAILAGWMQMLGDGEIAVRSLSLFFAVLSIVGFWHLTRLFFNPFISGLSGMMLTLNPMFLYYAIEARGYSMLLLTTIVSTCLFFLLLSQFSLGRLLLYVLLLSISVYTHYFGLLILPVHAGFLLLRKPSWQLANWLIPAWIAVVTLVSPLLIFRPLSTDQLYWMAPPTWRVMLKGLGLLFGGTGFLVAYLLLIGVAFWRGKNAPGRGFRQEVFLCSLWILLPVMMVFVFSLLIKPLFLYRYFIWLLPASALLAGLLFRQLRTKASWLAGLVGVLICAQAVPAYHELREKGSGYRDAASFIVRNARQGDLVIAYPFFKADHYSYYLGKHSRSDAFLVPQSYHGSPYLPGGGGREPDPDWHQLDVLLSRAERVFLISDPGTRETDLRLNRTALPAIEARMSSRLPSGQAYIFGERFKEPTRVLVLSR
jgi:hypothetical protein